MIDPIGSFEKIIDGYISYIKTAFGTRFKEFELHRDSLLHKDGILYRQPWVEPILKYKSSKLKISGIEELGSTVKKFVNEGLFREDRELYEHQYRMLLHSLRGENCIITSGTGSGKTESFLLPLFSYLITDLLRYTENAEMTNPIGPQTPGIGSKRGIDLSEGYGQLSQRIIQRVNPQRPAVVKALIVYPMNALVEDQLTRLRKSLDTDRVRSSINELLNGHRIYFGRYNGDSPVSGELHKMDSGNIVANEFTWNRLKKEIEEIEATWSETMRYIYSHRDELNQDEKDDLEINFQRLDGAEMRSRFDMQKTPPDILITNFSMLGIMMMRQIDSPIFEKTRGWLHCELSEDNELSRDRRRMKKGYEYFIS